MAGRPSIAEMADLRIAAADEFAGPDFENPITWHRRQKLPTDQLTIDTLFDNIYRKSVTLDQYGVRDHPEYIKWKIFGHNIVICYEYVSIGKPDKALEIIDDTEDLLKSIGNNDSFLKSIKIALDHVTFSMKGHVLKLCSLKTKLEDFIMPINMNNINKAGLFGIQALFLYYQYNFLCVNQSKENLLKAISLNDTEAEWYFLIAKVLHDASMNNNINYLQCSKQEFEMSKRAVEIGNKVQHKLHLVNSYYRMSKIRTIDENTRNQYSNARIKLINETMPYTNDLLLFKSSLKSLSNIYGNQAYNTKEKLINKLKSSNCGYVHNVIGKYYLNDIKDYEKALFHLKKAIDGNSFYGFYDYIITLLRMKCNPVPVEEILVDMLEKFPHPVHQGKILSQLISYKVITKRNIIGALEYIQKLLNIKNISCMNNLKKQKMHFCGYKTINLLDVLLEKLDGVLNNPALSTDNIKQVTDILNILESFKLNVSNLKKPITSNFESSNEPKNIQPKDKKQGVTYEKNINRENWRTLKPNSNLNSFIHHK